MIVVLQTATNAQVLIASCHVVTGTTATQNEEGRQKQ